MVPKFPLLYLVCLSVCLGAVEALRAGWTPPEPPVPPQPVERVGIAVPPKPQGAPEAAASGDGDSAWTEQRCRQLEGELRDVCLHQVARRRAPTDLEGALSACGDLSDAELQDECHADAAELHAVTNRDASLAVCPEIERAKWRDQCVFGIALALSTVDSPYAFRLCDDAGQWRDFCRHDVNGEIAQVNDPLAWEHCAADEGDLLTRKTCWHGIGKYVARVDVPRAFALCEKVPPGENDLYIENCYHGLGWGASEKAGRDFAAQCDKAGEKAPSCRLGVAYNLKRFDPAAALELCRAVGRQDLEDQCVQFVTQGKVRGR